MNKLTLTYEKSGVNIKATDRFVNFLSSKTEKTKKIGNLIVLVILAQLIKYPKNLSILI